MGLNAGDVISASAFTELKARIKAECARRKYNGSVASYAGASYDYTVTPTTGDVPLPEHFNKIIVPLNAIINTEMSQEASGDVVYQMSAISAYLTTLENIGATAASSGCKASCTGLCQGTCATGCTGCTTSCAKSCGSGCQVSCSVGCWNICWEDCATGCYSSCDRTCSPSCSNNCYTSCSGTCEGGCSSGCKGSCYGANMASPYIN